MTILNPNHQADLAGSGLSSETIEAAGIYSESDGRKLAGITNRKKWDRKYGSALVFPFYDEAGAIVLHRVKPDNRPQRNGKPGPKYLSPSGATVRAYFPPGMNGELHDTTKDMALTEGEKKSLAIRQAGLACIGLTGVDCWHTKKSSALLPDLARIEWKGRRVFIVFDSDAAENENVATNERLLAGVLKNHGAEVKIVRIPPGPNGEKVGIDDYLVANGPDSLWPLLEKAEDPEPATPDEVKQSSSEMLPEVEAERFLDATKKDGHPRLVYWRDCFWVWRHGRYEEATPAEVRSDISRHLNRRFIKVGQRSVGDVVGQLQAQSLLPNRIEAPAWLDNVPGSDWPVEELLIAKNRIVHLPSLFKAGETGSSVPPTPALFTLSALDFRFVDAEKCPRPDRWLAFLDQLWGDDPESIEALQQWFGYCLTPDARQHKLLGIFGPKRSGKTTIAQVLRRLVGESNTCAPTLSSLADRFGLWPLIGKTLAVIGDARLSGRADAASVAERLLSISGQDPMTVDRKNLRPVTVVFPARVVLISNELPRLTDASATIVSRMIVLRLSRSWFGKEDIRLLDKLTAELPSIVWWAVAGWQKLQKRGRLLQPQSSTDVLADLEDLASPVNAFLRDRCVVGADESVSRSALYEEYVDWCKDHGRKHVLDAGGLGRDLHAIIPTLRTTNPRVGGKPVRHYAGIGLQPLGD